MENEMIQAPIPSVSIDGGVQIFPFEYVEGLLAETLASSFHAVSTLKPSESRKLTMSKVENLRAVAAILYSDAMSTLDVLAPYHSASLNPKHGKVRAVLRATALKIDTMSLEVVRSVRHQKALGFASLAKDYLETFHQLLHPSTPPAQREFLVARFLVDHGPKGLIEETASVCTPSKS